VADAELDGVGARGELLPVVQGHVRGRIEEEAAGHQGGDHHEVDDDEIEDRVGEQEEQARLPDDPEP
jgi:hypothetical protein